MNFFENTLCPLTSYRSQSGGHTAIQRRWQTPQSHSFLLVLSWEVVFPFSFPFPINNRLKWSQVLWGLLRLSENHFHTFSFLIPSTFAFRGNFERRFAIFSLKLSFNLSYFPDFAQQPSSDYVQQQELPKTGGNRQF